MAPSIINQDLFVSGNLSSTTFTPPAGCVTDNAIVGNALIQATKLVGQNPGVTSGVQLFAPATPVATVTQTLGMAQAAGTLVAIGAWIEVAAVGAATVTIDLQASVGGGAYASVLTSTFQFNNATAVRTLVSGTINTAAYVAGTIFRAVVTATAGGGTLPQGLTLKLITRENPQ